MLSLEAYKILLGPTQGELTEKKSRFIARVFPVASEEEAFDYLEAVKKEYWDARHHCWAYIIGRNPGNERMSDDGEPSGTAGKPILEVLRGKGLTDVFVVVTRYFGGTLLGTGGLVKAYGDSAKEVLKIVRTEELIEKRSFRMVLPYSSYTLIKRAFEAVHASVVTEDFADMITVEGTIPMSEADALRKASEDIGQGRILLEIST